MFSPWFVRAPALALLAALLVVSLLDLWLELTDQATVGDHFARWSRRYPLFATALVLVLGLLVGHFFWQAT